MIAAPRSVLVVEDEALIRLSLVADLEDAGFAVYEAAGAEEALSLLSTHPEIEALFTDIDMPGSIDGLVLTQRARQSHPKIAILLTSGYLKIDKSELPPETAFFSKPYDVDHVVNHIRERVFA